MGADLFISYAWTSPGHREWVRLLAAHLKAIGYDVLVDADVDYGNDLNGFMRRAVDCRRVLLVIDENYVYRADKLPESGVGVEVQWFARFYGQKPRTWLSVLFKDNPSFRLPSWMGGHNPRGHSFNVNHGAHDFPGSEQVEELWRWIEDLPANRDHAVTAVTLRKRAKRLEQVDRQRDPNSWSNPSMGAEVFFEYERSPRKVYSVGFGEFGFDFYVSECGADSVYVLRDYIHAVGLNRSGAADPDALAMQLSSGRYVIACAGDQVIMQNQHGLLCLVDILEVQRESASPQYVPASMRFKYRVLPDS